VRLTISIRNVAICNTKFKIMNRINQWFLYGVMCSFFIWIKQKLCRHKKYEQGYWGELHIRKCDKCELIDVEVVLSKKNGFLKIK
jgi:hypothetical protein